VQPAAALERLQEMAVLARPLQLPELLLPTLVAAEVVEISIHLRAQLEAQAVAGLALTALQRLLMLEPQTEAAAVVAEFMFTTAADTTISTVLLAGRE